MELLNSFTEMSSLGLIVGLPLPLRILLAAVFSFFSDYMSNLCAVLQGKWR